MNQAQHTPSAKFATVDHVHPDTGDVSQYATVLVKLPVRFYNDHAERGLDTPKQIQGGFSAVWVELDDEALPELFSDARHYAHPSGPDACPPGIIASAKATVRVIEAARAAIKAARGEQ